MKIAEIEDALSAELTDADLIKSTLLGDNFAFEKLVLRYQRKVYRLVHRIVNNHFDASDIVQETFIKAYKGLPYLKNPDRFLSWLYQIAKNHCTDWLRHKHADLISIEKEITFDCLNLPATPDEILIENELHEQVMEAISKLPEHSRKAVQMFYIDGKSYAEIQNELGVKKGTLARWLYEARLQLEKASQYFSFVFTSLLRRIFLQSLSTQTLVSSTAISVTKCLVFSILFHAVIFSQIEFQHTNLASSHGQSYSNAFINASFMNDIPIENLDLNIGRGETPTVSMNGSNRIFRESDIKRIKILFTNVQIQKTKRLLPVSEKLYPEPQLPINATYQYLTSYKSSGDATYIMNTPRALSKISLYTKNSIQPASIALANTEISDENDDKLIINQNIESNKYELVRTILDKPSKILSVSAKMTLDKNGNIYIADTGGNCIKVLSPSGELLTSWGGRGHDQGKFMRPVDIAVDDEGNTYVADSGNFRIQKFDYNGNFVKEWGKKGFGEGTKLLRDPDNFKNIVDLIISDSGYLYVMDAGNNRICKYNLDGSQKDRWGEKGKRDGQFRTPTSIAVDKDGYIYVADNQDCRIQKFEGYKFITKWGTRGTGDGKFIKISAIAIDNFGNVLVVDASNGYIQKFTSNGKFLAKWGKKSANYDSYWRGEIKETSDDELMFPSDIAIAKNGDIYVHDGWRIKVFRQKAISSK